VRNAYIRNLDLPVIILSVTRALEDLVRQEFSLVYIFDSLHGPLLAGRFLHILGHIFALPFSFQLASSAVLHWG